MLEMILGQIWPYVLGALALVAGWITARQTGKAAGRTEAKMDQLQADALARSKRDEAVAHIDRLDDDGVRDRARQRMRNTGR